MTRSKAKCRRYITFFFIMLIACLIGSLYYQFHYLDFAYLIVVVVGFIRFLNVREKN
jgi:hypothetical protein